MLTAITRKPSPLLETGERTHIGRDAIDYDRALAQHAAYCAALSECGAAVQRLDDADAFPDGVFVEDTALVLPEVAIIMRPGAPSRRPEVDGIERALRAFRNTVRVADPAAIDGGDIVVTGQRILVGRSARTNDAGVAALAQLTKPHGYSVSSVGLDGCLHLKSGCTALPDGRLLVNPHWVRMSDLSGFSHVEVDTSEPWAGDVAIVGETVIEAASFPRTIDLLEREGFRVRPVDVAEFAKAEGGVTCMSLVFDATAPSS